MVETIGVRLEYLREKIFNLSQGEFAKKLGVSQRTISGMENGDVSAKNILKLESLGVNRKWVETGEGEIFSKDVVQQPITKAKNDDIDIVNVLIQENGFLKEEIKFLRNLITNQNPTSQMTAR